MIFNGHVCLVYVVRIIKRSNCLPVVPYSFFDILRDNYLCTIQLSENNKLLKVVGLTHVMFGGPRYRILSLKTEAKHLPTTTMSDPDSDPNNVSNSISREFNY